MSLKDNCKHAKIDTYTDCGICLLVAQYEEHCEECLQNPAYSEKDCVNCLHNSDVIKEDLRPYSDDCKDCSSLLSGYGCDGCNANPNQGG